MKKAKEKALLIHITAAMHKGLKHIAAEEEKTMQQIVFELIQKRVEKAQKSTKCSEDK